jgi:hypothetical protein
MKFYQEITKWQDQIPNGVYLLNDSKTKMFAYVKPGAKSAFKFKNPIGIDTRGRKFEPVSNTFGYQIEKEVSRNPQWTVTGSKGDTYTVEKTENGYTCTCSGFKFRGKCKHIDSVDK